MSEKSLTTRFVYDLNINFAQFPFREAMTGEMSVTVPSPPTTLSQVGQVSTVQFKISIKEQLGDERLPAGQIRIILDSPWRFDALANIAVTTANEDRYAQLVVDNSTIYDRNLYRAPTAPSKALQSPNILVLTFPESLPSGKTFYLQVTGIVSPSTFGESKISVFTYQYNSDQVAEYNPNVLALKIQQTQFSSTVLNPYGFDLSQATPVKFYRGQMQYLRLSFTPLTAIPQGYSMRINFGQNNLIIKGSVYVDPSIQPSVSSRPIGVSYPSSSVLLLSNLGALLANTAYFVQVRLLLNEFEANLQV